MAVDVGVTLTVAVAVGLIGFCATIYIRREIEWFPICKILDRLKGKCVLDSLEVQRDPKLRCTAGLSDLLPSLIYS